MKPPSRRNRSFKAEIIHSYGQETLTGSDPSKNG